MASQNITPNKRKKHYNKLSMKAASIAHHTNNVLVQDYQILMVLDAAYSQGEVAMRKLYDMRDCRPNKEHLEPKEELFKRLKALIAPHLIYGPLEVPK